MCGCQEGFCCFSYVSISKNSSPNHQNGIQKSSKSPKWDFELGSGFRETSEIAYKNRANSLEIFVVQQIGCWRLFRYQETFPRKFLQGSDIYRMAVGVA